MMNNKLVSVIIPTYNRANYILEAVNSVLGQSYKTFEIIIVDDGSTDNTESVIQHLNDPRIFYYKIKHSGIPAVARNYGMRKSKGQFIAFLDSDDLWLPAKLELSINCFTKTENIGIVTSKEFIVDANANTTGIITFPDITEDYILNFESLFFNNIVSSSAAIIKRECIESIGYFDESTLFRTVEDNHYWWKIASQYEVYFLNEITGNYRMHNENISKNLEENLISLYNSVLDICIKYKANMKNFEKAPSTKLKNIQKKIFKYYFKKNNLLQTLMWFIRILAPITLSRTKYIKY